MQKRQLTLQNQLDSHQALLIRQSPPVVRNKDVHHPFHPDRSAYYLFGIEEPNCWILMLKNSTALFSEENTDKKTLWEGAKLAENSIALLPVDQWLPLDQFDSAIAKMLTENGIQTLYTNTALDLDIVTQPLDTLLTPLRVIKDEDEITAMRKACDISAHAHNHLMRVVSKRSNERELEGDFIQQVYHKGQRDLAYPCIVASGENALTLHYNRNDAPLAHDQLILVDAGCQYQQYASDITRTFPKSGTFTSTQLDVYEAVLDTQLKCLEMLKPGIQWKEVQQCAVASLSQHLVELGICDGPVEQVIKTKAYIDYFPHGVGHSIGLDVHDIKIEPNQILEAGMVVTIEPGLYIREHPKYGGIGIRIEDVALITPDGHENLSQAAVKIPKEIEALCREE